MSIKLNAGARIRILIGFLAITLGLMDFVNPTVSNKWKWLRDWATNVGGEHGYAVLLLSVGGLFILWAIFESVVVKGEEK